MANFVGIDLGTSFSVVATLDHVGMPVIVRDTEGKNLTASAVWFESENDVWVGSEARQQLETNPDAFGGFKREMGTDKQYLALGKTHSPTDLSAMVLAKLKGYTEVAIGTIDEAVITIPANFSHEARDATMQAAQTAGLSTKHIINEPTAAALYYAHQQGETLHGVYAVYDLGGGTFDVSIIQVDGEDVEVLASNGIGKLGGDDFDRSLQELVRAEFKKITSSVLNDSDYTRFKAEQDKISLSRREKVVVDAGGENISITRSMFEQSISTLIAQTEMICESTILEAGVSPDAIKSVFLAGGSTRIPTVKKSVNRVFGQDGISTANVDEVVALGAALYAAYKSDESLLNPLQKQAVDKLNVTERTGKSFGIISINQEPDSGNQKLQNSVLIPKGTVIPKSVVETFYTTRDGQTAVRCQVTESTTPETDPRFVHIVWEGNLGLPPGRPQGQEVLVKFSYDESQMLHCLFTDSETSRTTEVNLRMAENMSKAKSDIEKFTVN